MINNILLGGSEGVYAISNDSLPGLTSDYNVVVGRSRLVEGPYVDRDGKLISLATQKGLERPAGLAYDPARQRQGKLGPRLGTEAFCGGEFPAPVFSRGSLRARHLEYSAG